MGKFRVMGIKRPKPVSLKNGEVLLAQPNKTIDVPDDMEGSRGVVAACNAGWLKKLNATAPVKKEEPKKEEKVESVREITQPIPQLQSEPEVDTTGEEENTEKSEELIEESEEDADSSEEEPESGEVEEDKDEGGSGRKRFKRKRR